VELFLTRAQAVKQDFRLTAENAATVAAICRRLDGLPLALELAATWVKLLSPQALLARLESRLPLLVGGAHDLPQRQRTLSDTIAWSYDLLGLDEQALFRQFGVFFGGCTLEAVEAVCSAGNDREYTVLDHLVGLVDKSLVQQIEQPDGEFRFRMLETIREYGQNLLEREGEAKRLQRTHSLYYLEFVENAHAALSGPSQKGILMRLEEEHDNVRAALSWASEQLESDIGLRFAAALWPFWYMRGHVSEGRQWLDRLLAEPDEAATIARVRALNGAGVLAANQGDTDRAIALLEESVAQARRLGDQEAIASGLGNLATLAEYRCEYKRAATLLEESLTIERQLGDRFGIAHKLYWLGIVSRRQGDYLQATKLCEESAALFRELENLWYLSTALAQLGAIVREQGTAARARSLLEEALALCRTVQNRAGMAAVFVDLAAVAHDQGDEDRATELVKEGLAIHHELDNRAGIADALTMLAVTNMAQGHDSQALALYRESLNLCRSTGDLFCAARCLEGAAQLAGRHSQPVSAARLLGAANALRKGIGAPPPPVERPTLDRVSAEVRLALASYPHDAFAREWAAGAAFGLDEATMCVADVDVVAGTYPDASSVRC
jgi:tetratricopeptide (TPR) repeat protein